MTLVKVVGTCKREIVSVFVDFVFRHVVFRFQCLNIKTFELVTRTSKVDCLNQQNLLSGNGSGMSHMTKKVDKSFDPLEGESRQNTVNPDFLRFLTYFCKKKIND